MALATALVCGGCDDEDPCSGDVIILEPSDFSAIADCTSISGSLIIECPLCTDTDLSELDSLTSVGGGLEIYNTDTLTNLDGLAALTSVGGSLSISGNVSLTNLNGLSGLTSVTGNLLIGNDYNGGNPVLTNLDGLSGLTSVGNEFRIIDNPTLPDCEVCDLLDQLTTAPTSINVHDNLDDTCTPVPTNCP